MPWCLWLVGSRCGCIAHKQTSPTTGQKCPSATDEEIKRQVNLLTPKIGESKESADQKLARIKTYAEAVTRSVPVLIGLSIAYSLSCVLGWNLDNADRAKYQRLLVAGGQNARGAFLVLAGEAASVLALIYMILRALLVWQG